MSFGIKRPDRVVEYQDKFKSRHTIEIRFWENNAKEITFCFDVDAEWGHTLVEEKWREFVEILKSVRDRETEAGKFEYEFDGDRHELEYRRVSKKDEYNYFKSDLLRFRSICSYTSQLEGTEGEVYDCEISFDIPTKILDDFIKSLESSEQQTPNWKAEVRQ
jgi:hypothetical protein